MSTLRYAITDRAQYGEDELDRRAALVAQAGRLAAEGVDFLQLREKDLPTQDLIGLTREILNAIGANSPDTSVPHTRLLVNSRVDVALAASADGVHLPSGEDQLTPAQIRQIFASAGVRRPVVSVSCHTLADVSKAHGIDGRHAPDLILFGAVFGKSVSGQIVVPETGLEVLSAACILAGEIPVLALGGVTHANAALCIAAGASGIAAIRLFR